MAISAAIMGALAASIRYGNDPYFSNVSLLSYLEGSEGSTSLVDSSQRTKTITPYGGASLTTSNYKFGGSSLRLTKATSSHARITHHSDLDLSTGAPDWTLEGFVYFRNAPTDNQTLFDKDGVSGSAYPSYTIGTTAARALRSVLGNGSSAVTFQVFNGITAIPLSTWVHIAVCRKGSLLMGFVEGKLEFKSNITITMVDGGKPIYVGYSAGQPSGSYGDNDYDNLRITKNICRYDGSSNTIGDFVFTPPVVTFPNI